MPEENNIDHQAKRPFIGRLLRFLAVMFLLLFLLSVLMTLIIRDSDFQNWAVKKVTTALSEQLVTEVDTRIRSGLGCFVAIFTSW